MMHEHQAEPALAGDLQASEPQRRDTRWPKGASGNPAGKKPGYGKLQKLRAGLNEHLPDILNALVERAKAGDTQAIKLVLERTLPAVRPIEYPQALSLPQDGSLTDQGRAIIDAVSAGDLAPSQAAQLVAALASLARVIEIDQLTARVAALEEKSHAGS